MSGEAARIAPFGERLELCVRERESQIVVGLDPDPRSLWPDAVDAAPPAGSAAPHDRAADAVIAHCGALIDSVAPACVAAKLQLACFERLGPAAARALFAVAAHARDRGLLVIADGKRGDISVSAAAYAQALFGGVGETPFGPLGGLGADVATVNPLMGRDAVQPFVEAARAVGGGVLLLVRTSNPGAADVEELALSAQAAVAAGSSATVSEALARMVHELAATGTGALGDVGAVVGATAPQRLARLRELMPRAVFLLPGVGAQGGRVEDLAAAFAPARAAGLITASRSIAEAWRSGGGDPAARARAEAERLRELAWKLSDGG